MSMNAALLAGSVVLSGTVTGAAVHDPVGPVQGLASWGSTEVVFALDGGDRLTFRLPGDNGGAHQVLGVPRLEPGQPWLIEFVDGAEGLTPRGLGRGMTPLFEPERYLLNEFTYLPEQLPLEFVLLEPGSEDLGFDETEALVIDSLAAWTDVRCSSFEFRYAGRTDVIDAYENWLGWEETDWPYDPMIAGLTETHFGPFGDLEYTAIGADVAFNGVDWDWVDGPGTVGVVTHVVGARSIITHELGHVTGLGHELGVLPATMYGGYFGGDWQGTLAGDDRRGLCEKYGNGEDECAVDEDCADVDGSERLCVPIDGINICEETRDPLGAECGLSAMNCGDTCVISDLNTGTGYCSYECEASACPAGWLCSAVGLKIPQGDELVCVPDPDYEEPTPEPAPTADDDDDDDVAGCAAGGGAAVLLFAPLGVRRRK